MPRAHYHVGYNMAGYLPEMDVYTVSSKRDAIAAVSSEYRMLNEWCGVDGHEHGAYIKAGGNGDIWLTPRQCAGSGAVLHIWHSDHCECPEGTHELKCPNDWHGSHCDK